MENQKGENPNFGQFKGKLLNGEDYIEGYLISACEIRTYTSDEWKGDHVDHVVDPATVTTLNNA